MHEVIVGLTLLLGGSGVAAASLIYSVAVSVGHMTLPNRIELIGSLILALAGAASMICGVLLAL